MLSLEWRPRALLDRESIALYLGHECGNPKAALKVVRAIDQALQQACDFPEIGKPFTHEVLAREGYRQLVVRQYLVFYTHDAARLTVQRILHQHQDIDDYALIEFE